MRCVSLGVRASCLVCILHVGCAQLLHGQQPAQRIVPQKRSDKQPQQRVDALAAGHGFSKERRQCGTQLLHIVLCHDMAGPQNA
jgi:hypothetical protein